MDDELIAGVFLTRVCPCLWQQPYYYVYAWVLIGSDARLLPGANGTVLLIRPRFVSLHQLRLVSLSLAVTSSCRQRDWRLDCAAKEVSRSRIDRCWVRKDDGRASMGQRQC